MKNKKNLELKHVQLQVKEVAEDGTFSGYGSVFGVVDSYGDIVEAGAFKRTLNARGSKIRLLWQHNPSAPIGKFTSLAEDESGLRFTGKLNLNVQQGREAYEHLKHGDLDGMSIGFSTEQDEYDSVGGVRRIKEVKLYEISLVTFPANEEATITSVKSDGTGIETRFENLTHEQRLKVLSLINSFKQSPSEDDPLDDESESASEDEEDEDGKPAEEDEDEKSSEEEEGDDDEHSDDPEPDTDEDDDPQEEDKKSLLHSLKQLNRALVA